MVALDALGRVVGAIAPLDGKVHHLAHDGNRSIGLKDRTAPGDPAMQSINIGNRNICNLDRSKPRQDLRVDNELVVALSDRALLRQMLFDKPLTQVGNARCPTDWCPLTHGIAALGNPLLQVSRLSPGRANSPLPDPA